MEGPAAIGFRTSPRQRSAWHERDTRSQLVIGIDGPLAMRGLKTALAGVRRRHEILRTRVVIPEGQAEPVQVIDAEGDGPDEVVDLSPATADSAAFEAVLAREWRAISSDDGRLFRAVLVNIEKDCAALVLTAHPLIADAESLHVIYRELADLYAGSEPPPVAIQHADFASWHNDRLADGAREKQRRYWDRHVDPALARPASDLLAPQAGVAGDWQTVQRPVSPSLLRDVEILARAVGVGPHEVIATAWAIVLWRLSGERDLILTTGASGRHQPELEGAVGPYAREVPLVCRFADGSLRSALTQVRRALTDALGNIDDLDPARLRFPSGASPGPVPAFTAIVESDPIIVGELRWRVLADERRPAAPVLLRSVMAAEGLSLRLGYDTAQISDVAATALLDRMMVALTGFVASPDAPLETVALLLPDEAEALLALSNGGHALGVADADVAELIGDQAVRTPGAIALDDGRRQVTYADLVAQADGLAQTLVDNGVRPGDRVVLWLPRGCDFVVALLGVWRAGAAYVPVDIRQPLHRLQLTVADAEPALVVTSQGSPPVEGIGAAVVGMEGALRSGSSRAVAADPDRAAYVMYTSGSTGRPNGVAVTHRALLNYLLWAVEAYGLRTGAGTLAHSSVGFDLTITPMIAPLLAGQRVHLTPEGPGLDHLVEAVLAEADITLLKATPSQLAALLDVVGPQELLSRVRTLVLGGEALRAEVIGPLRGGPTRIVNEYGPTETVVGSCAHEVSAGTAASGAVPIGRPICGTRLYVLDSQGRPVPDGVPGELYIGGAGVATGYLGRPDLTQAKFVADPMVPGARAYRTGDRVRRLAGELTYEGRLDDQLKVLGVRIEPGEIEAVLREHPGVGQAAVAAWQPDGAPAPIGLAAQIVAAQGVSAPTSAELAAHCRTRLPDYLVPMIFAPAPALPMTANGKLDRRAVAAVLAAHARVETQFVAPRNETEEILAGAIAKVLGRERVGIDDNYFAIGGDSIRSVMVVSRAQADGVGVSVADLHRIPTVRALAEALSAAKSGTAEPLTAPFSLISADDRLAMPPDVEDAFPLNLLQEGMIFHRDFAAKSAVYHAIATVRLRAPFDLDVMRRVINELVARHPMLRTSFDQATFSKPLQLVHKTFRDPLGFEDLRGRTEAEQQARVEAFVASEKARGFELDEYPLIRFMVHRLDDESFQFTYGFHHEIVDGWSEALMVTELFGHYFSLVFGDPVSPKAPTSTMRDAIALELDALGRKENYEFWAEYLADAALMRLPRLDSGPAADKGAREIVRIAVTVTPELSDALKRLALSRTVPLKSVLLAAHMAVMHHYHGQNDTLTYTVTNGRPESADGSTAIGLFVNSLALRLRMRGGSWHDLIAQTLESERRSLPYRRLPMAELKRHQGNEPLAETLFFFTDYHVFHELDRWRDRGVEHMASELYGESTFPFCAIFRLSRLTGDLEVRLEYDSLQFRGDLMDRMAECYQQVLETMVADPDAPYHLQSPLSDGEAAHVQRLGLGDPALDGGATLPELFAAQARSTPDTVAVVSEAGCVTYAALDRWARRIEAGLRGRGAGPEHVVGVLAERSLEAVAAILAILRSGAAYLPLDPSQPDERLQAIADDAKPLLVLAQTAHTQRLCAPAAVEELSPTPPAEEPAVAVRQLSPENLAYVIYTSGSTGKPKGVAVTHRGLANSTLARGVAYPHRPERYLLVSPLVFDSSVAGLFWPLTSGGSLHLAREGAQLEPGDLLASIQRQMITHILCVPSLLAALTENDRSGCLSSVGTIIVAGEASPRELHEAVKREAPQSVLYNEYGPTENTVWSTVWTGEPPSYRAQLPIGRPVAGVRTYVLNQHLSPVPVGVPGELYLAGVGVARGYAGDAARTAAAFLPDPFAPSPGERMYRSGDLARYDGNDELEFLGRADNQVKIHGFRIELGEIEGILDSHPDVYHCVVVPRDLGAGGKSLAAYVVASGEAAIDEAGLQRYLRDRLPKYMVPAAIAVLDKLPLTRTGKVDRSALPAITMSPSRDSAPVPPATDTEQVVAALWCQALGLDEVGIHDGFFDIGGESLRAMQVVTRTNKVFGLNLSVRALFDTATIARFAQVVDEARAESNVDAAAGAVAG